MFKLDSASSEDMNVDGIRFSIKVSNVDGIIHKHLSFLFLFTPNAQDAPSSISSHWLLLLSSNISTDTTGIFSSSSMTSKKKEKEAVDFSVLCEKDGRRSLTSRSQTQPIQNVFTC